MTPLGVIRQLFCQLAMQSWLAKSPKYLKWHVK